MLGNYKNSEIIIVNKGKWINQKDLNILTILIASG